MGPFPVKTKQAKFLVVAIDYFTKWVEAEPLAKNFRKECQGFRLEGRHLSIWDPKSPDFRQWEAI